MEHFQGKISQFSKILNKPSATRQTSGGDGKLGVGFKLFGVPVSIGLKTSVNFNVNLEKVKANKRINAQLNNEIEEFRKAGFPVTNKNAFKAFRRSEIASGRKTTYTPAQAKAAANEALRKSAGGALLGAGLAVAAPAAVLVAGAGAGGAVSGGVTGQGQRIAGQQGAQILNKSRKLQKVKNLLIQAQTRPISFADMANAVNKVAGPFKNRVAAALGGHIQSIPALLSEMTVASAII